MDSSTILIIVGSVFVFFGILGGGLRVKELQIGRLPGVGRVAAGAVGGLLLALGIVWGLGVLPHSGAVNPFQVPRIVQVAVTGQEAPSPVQEGGPITALPGETVLFWYNVDSSDATESGLGASI